jgi:polyhydroxyalkanoate synthase subunit PhaC
MVDQPTDHESEAAGAAIGENMEKLGAQWQRLFQAYMKQLGDTEKVPFDPATVGNAFLKMSSQMLANPQHLAEAQAALWQQYAALWQTAAQGTDEPSVPVAAPEKGDRRFNDADWSENQVFDLLKQSYLITSRWLQKTVGDVEGLDNDTRHKVDFYTRQFVDAMSPTNFFLTNPEVIRTTLESHGENLVHGLDNLLNDLEGGKGISQTDPDAFEVGRNLANTPGKVVFQNRIIQLIQYTPTTAETYALPLLICPPWINKYYILDLKPENSLIAWAVSQGFTVFVISWVNPDDSFGETSFEDYINDGLLAAMDAVLKATGQSKLNVVGYCAGGTLLATTLAVLTAKNDDRIHSATFLTTLVDFADAGDLQVFIDEEQIALLDESMGESGVLGGRRMAATFNMMRANDLIWSFVVKNYLLGKDPIPFDLLYWNADGTNMPHAMHSYYLRNMYLNNLLAKPGALELAGVPIDLRTIDLPTYTLSTKEDHIAPWRSCYRLPQIVGGEKRFVLAQSGHVAGVVSAPGKTKYGHWTNDALPKDAESWLSSATEHEGSWWPDWAAWLSVRSGDMVAARDPSKGPLKVIEDAPGSYVMKAID